MYVRTPPAAVLEGIAPDRFEVQGLAAQPQPATVQARLSAAMAVLALMTADALMKLGEISRDPLLVGEAPPATATRGSC